MKFYNKILGMKRVFVTLLSFLVGLQVYAYDLVLPAERKNTVTTDYAFFVGKVNGGENLTINDKPVYTASNGAFAHSVKLKKGNNRIILRSNYNTKIFTFCKNDKQAKIEEPFQAFDMKKAVVINDNTPIRNTPIDAGMNRIGHLYRGTNLILDGEQGDFYRIFLSSKKNAWIAKKAVEMSEKTESEPAEFIGMKSTKYKNATVQTITFSKKLPYTVEDKEKEIIFRIYNPELSENSVYNLNLPKPDKKPEKYSYSVKLDDGQYTFKVKSMPHRQEEYTVVIDAGHGGSEKGAIGCLGDEEKDINLKIAYELQAILSNAGINAIMTRECDGNSNLYDRVKLAEDNEAQIFVSIHLNSIPDIPMNIYKNRGTEVYYYNNNSKKLAEYVENAVVHSVGTKSGGIKTASYAVIRSPQYAGILVEAAYITNPLDSLIYSSDDFAFKAASGIAKGILKYIKY